MLKRAEWYIILRRVILKNCSEAKKFHQHDKHTFIASLFNAE